MTQFAVDVAFVGTLIVLGRWLETINGKHGWVDEYLTWAPMGASGLLWIGLERVMG
jgi:hypothetical protein